MTKELVQDKINELNKGPYPIPITIIDYALEEPQLVMDHKIVVINYPEEMTMMSDSRYEIFYLNYPETLDGIQFKGFVTSISFVDSH